MYSSFRKIENRKKKRERLENRHVTSNLNKIQVALSQHGQYLKTIQFYCMDNVPHGVG